MNNSITESYCSFEVSKLLKEKGFDRITQLKINSVDTRNYDTVHITYWCDTNNDNPAPDTIKPQIVLEKTGTNSNKFHGLLADYEGKGNWIRYYEAPTTALAIKWAKDNFGIHIIIAPRFYGDESLWYCYEVIDISKNTRETLNESLFKGIFQLYKTYEDAENSAIKEFLNIIL